MKFDGRAFAREIEMEVALKVPKMVTKPKIVSVLVGDDPASTLYTKLKKAAAERVGIQFDVIKLDSGISSQELGIRIGVIGERRDVTGVMVQLPVQGPPGGEASLQGQSLQDVLSAIPFTKDVDGLRYPESGVVPPVVAAVLKVIDKIDESQISNSQILKLRKYVVIGATGFVGSALCLELEKRGKEVSKVDSDTKSPADVTRRGDVVISCTGKEGIVSGDMIRSGSIVIDVGAPLGDMTREAYERASVSVEVPGGVGPVTIACLLQNAVE